MTIQKTFDTFTNEKEIKSKPESNGILLFFLTGERDAVELFAFFNIIVNFFMLEENECQPHLSMNDIHTVLTFHDE